MPTVTIAGGSTAEGNGNSDTILDVSINLNTPATAQIAVGYRLLSGTGKIGNDAGLFFSSGTANFAVGEQSRTIRIRTENDTVPEPDEALVLEAFVISGDANFLDGAPVARSTIFILDEDGFATPNAIFVSRPVVKEGDGGSRAATFEVSLSRPASEGFSIPYSTQSGSATAGEDFIATSGRLAFVTGQSSATVDVPVLGDTDMESNEQFSLRITPPGGFGEVSVGAAAILDDDTASNGPSVSVAGATVSEGRGNLDTFPIAAINLSSPAGAPIPVGYRLISGTATVGEDIDLFFENGTASFAVGEQSDSISMRTDNDNVPEADEFALLEVFIENIATNSARIAGNSTVDQAIIWVLDDDGAGQPAIGVTSPSVIEDDAGQAEAVIKLSLSRPAAQAFRIDYTTVPTGSALPGRDYVPVSGSIAVAAGQQEFSFGVPILPDRMVEGQETFLVSLSPSIFYAGAVISTITILDNDVAPPRPTGGNDLIDYRGYTTAQIVRGLDGNDVIHGGLVRDTLFGDGGNDNLYGEGSSDVLRGGSGFDRLFGGAGNDNLGGNGEDDFLAGQDGNDLLIGGAGRDRLYGGAGNDVLEGGSGGDLLAGGAGRDMASYAASQAGVSVNLTAGRAGGGQAIGDRFVSIENLRGSAFADQLVGTAGANLIEGGTGNDRLYGGAGNDLLDGGRGADLIAGGAGFDIVRYSGSNAGVAINLNARAASRGDAQGDRITNIEGAIGSNFADVLMGSRTGNTLDGGRGGDVLIGFGGNDILIGGGGNDTLRGDSGADVLRGGGGNDIASYAASGAGVNVNLATGVASGGHAEGDRLFDIESLLGSGGADVLVGDGGANRLRGGSGTDGLTGGRGADVFDFIRGAGIDRVTDFENAADRIDLSGYAGVTSYSDIARDIVQIGADVHIVIGADRMILEGVRRASISAEDFLT